MSDQDVSWDVDEDPSAYEDSYSLEMCPASEREMRLENDLVHPLEKIAGHPQGRNARHYRMIKKFNRSAAGHKISDDQLRSPAVCLRTASYLVREFVTGGGGDLDRTRYDFVFDRLRAVRQDLWVQQESNGRHQRITSRVLAICVRFHLLAGYSLCQLPASEFDPSINFTHALECLKMLLVILAEEEEGRGDPPLLREEMSAAYLMLNLGSPHSVLWGLGRRDRLPSASLTCNLRFLERNHAALFKLVRNLPATALLAFHWKFPAVLSEVLAVMSAAYSSRSPGLAFPSAVFSRLFCLDQPVDFVATACATIGIRTVGNGAAIAFNKKEYEENKHRHSKIPHFRSNFADAKLLQMDLERWMLTGEEELRGQGTEERK